MTAMAMTTPYQAYAYHLHAQGEGKAWGSGNTIILPLSDSHMSLHASEELGIVFLDLFSCRDFDANKVLSFIERRWGGRWTAKLYDRSEEDQLMWTYPILSRL